jgi:ankyrin repeat protein
MKAAVLLLSSIALVPNALADDAKPRSGRLPATCEVVMSPGMKITATTSVGTISVTAADEMTRAYTWDGATRAVEMGYRANRWYGSLGLFNVGAGEHWRDHHGITRCVTEEGQQHFKTIEEALEWIKKRDWYPFVYRNDGLMVGWNKFLPRKQLNVEVWQILIDGKKPKQLPGSQDGKIVVENVETETVPLVKAVATDDLNAVRTLLAKGVDPNVKSNLGVPVLLVAVKRELVPIVEALLKSGADPNVRDVDTDFTPLLMAALGQFDIAKLLLAAGADVNATIRKENDLFRGMTPLMLAVDEGSEDLIQLLLDKGADVNAKAPNGDTALSLATDSAPKKRQGVIRMLESAATKSAPAAGAPRADRVPADDELVMSPRMRITANTSVGKIAITAVDQETRSYSWDGETFAVERLPAKVRFFAEDALYYKGTGERWRGHHGITHCLTKENNKLFITLEDAMAWIKEPERATFVYRGDGLIVGWSKAADPKRLTVEVWQILIDGKKPTRLAGNQDDKVVVETVETETVPLVKAVASSDLKAVTDLLTQGADANVKNSVEMPVLIMAIRRGSAPVVEALLKHKADPNVRLVDTDLPLLVLVVGLDAPVRAEIAKALIAAGADLNAASRKRNTELFGVTPLMVAAADGCDDLVQLFLDKGADINVKTPEGFTAHSLAKSFGLHKEDNQGVIRKLEAAGAKK